METDTNAGRTVGAQLLRCATVWLLASIVLAGMLVASLGAAAAPASLLATEVAGLVAHTDAAAGTNPAVGGDPMARALLLVAGCGGALAAVRLWWTVSATCWQAVQRLLRPGTGTPASATPGRSAPGRSPLGVQRLTLAACGLGVATVAVVPAHAADLSGLDGLPHPDRPTHGRAVLPEPEPGAVEEPPGSTAGLRPAPAKRATNSEGTAPSGLREASGASAGEAVPMHLVRTGDTLWDIAEEQLSRRGRGDVAPAPPARPPLVEVVAQVRALHHDNRSVVGADPDLLLPGQELRLPEAPAPDDDAPTSTGDPSPAPAPAPAPAEENR